MGTGLLVIDDDRGTPLCVGRGDLKSCGLGAVLVCRSEDEYVKKAVEWLSKCGKEGNLFLREKQDNKSDYYDPKRVPVTIEKAVDLILGGKLSIDLSQESAPSSLFVDRREAGILHIYDQLNESLSKRQPGYMVAFKAVVEHLSNEYGVVFNSVSKIGRDMYVIEGQLMCAVAGYGTSIESGTNVTVLIESKVRSQDKLYNSVVFRDWKNAKIMKNRMRGSKHHPDMFSRPFNLLNQCQSSLGMYMVHPSTRQIIVFSTFQHEETESFELMHSEVARNWYENGIIPHILAWKLQIPLHSLYHAHRNGIMIQKLDVSNMVWRNNGRGVKFLDLTLARLFAPIGGFPFARESGATNLTRRSSTHFFPNGFNPDGGGCMYRASGRYGKGKDPHFRFLTDSDLAIGERLAHQSGMGSGSCGRGEFTYFEEAEHARRDGAGPNEVLKREDCEREDAFQYARGMLRFFHGVRGDPAEWERQVLAATADGNAQKVLAFMLEGRRDDSPCLQPQAALRFAKLIAGGLRPGPDRASILDLLTHPAVTTPIFSPEDEARLASEGILFPGGLVDDVVSNLDWAGWVLPATAAQYEPAGAGENGCLGVGMKATAPVVQGGLVSFYVGTERKISDGTGVLDCRPTRYGVSVNSDQQKDKFIVDGAVGEKLTVDWLKTNQVTGPFMNAGDWSRGVRSNVRLDRHLAWKDPATGLVWMPMFALRPIAAGEFLRFKYDPTAGEGGAYRFNLG
jgi:hypothetical protein